MKNLKYKFGILMSFLAIAGLSSCTQEVEYTPAEPIAVETSEYYFTQGTETGLAITPLENQIVAEINRANTENEVTLDLKVVNNHKDLFTIPTSVTFAAGEATANVVIEVNDEMPFFENYEFAISIDEKYTNPYIEQNNNPTLHYVVMRTDYRPYAKGIYTSYFWEDAWEAYIEYSEILGLCRFKDCWFEGYDVTFELNFETMEFKMSEEKAPSGYTHPSYGMVYAGIDMNKSGFDPETQTLIFSYDWLVSTGAGKWGTFGNYPDTFQITEVYDEE